MDERPPLGLMPRSIFVEKRVNEIIDAMKRYSAHGMPVPSWWVDELEFRLAELEGQK